MARLHSLRLVVLLVGALLGAALLAQVGPDFRFDLGSEALSPHLRQDFFGVEQGGGHTFRQSQPTARLPLPVITDIAAVNLVLAGNTSQPRPLTITIDRQRTITLSPPLGFRSYQLLLPPTSSERRNDLTLSTSPLLEPNGSGRQIGVAVERISVTFPRSFGSRTLDFGLIARSVLLVLCLHVLWLFATHRTRRVLDVSSGALLILLPVIQVWMPDVVAGLLGLLLALALLATVGIVLRSRMRGPIFQGVPALFGAQRWRLPLELALWGLLTVVMTFPFVTNLRTALPDNLDSYLNSWILAWDHHQLWQSPIHLFDANILRPYPLTLGYSDHLLGLYPLTGPLLALQLDPAFVHNIALFLAFLLSGFGMRLLVYEVTGNPVAALGAGLIYAFYPYRLIQMGHIQQASTEWMPFIVWALERFRREGSWKYASAAGGFAVMQSLVSYYHAVFVAVIVLLYGLFFLVADPRFRQRQRLVKLIVVGCCVILIHLPLALPYLYLQRRLGLERSVSEARGGSATLADYLSPDRSNCFYQLVASSLDLIAPYRATPFTSGLQDWVAFSGRSVGEQTVFPGVLPTFFAAVGAVAFRRRRIVKCMLLVLLASFIFSLGPELRLSRLGDSVLRVMPFRYLPFSVVVRVPARFAWAELVALAVLAGCGITALLQWLTPRYGRAVAPVSVLCLLLIGSELLRLPVPLVPLVPPDAEVEQWLSRQPPGLDLHLPDRQLDREARYEYDSTAHFRPMLNGYSGYFRLPALDGLLDSLSTPQPDELLMLQGLGVRYVIMHWDEMQPGQPAKYAAQLGRLPDMKQAASLSHAAIYELAPDPWADHIAAYLGQGQTLYVSSGGTLPRFYAQLLALRFEDRAVAGRTRLGFLMLPEAPPGHLPDYGLFGIGEDPASAGYREADVVWHNRLFKLIRRPNP